MLHVVLMHWKSFILQWIYCQHGMRVSRGLFRRLQYFNSNFCHQGLIISIGSCGDVVFEQLLSYYMKQWSPILLKHIIVSWLQWVYQHVTSVKCIYRPWTSLIDTTKYVLVNINYDNVVINWQKVYQNFFISLTSLVVMVTSRFVLRMSL